MRLRVGIALVVVVVAAGLGWWFNSPDLGESRPAVATGPLRDAVDPGAPAAAEPEPTPAPAPVEPEAGDGIPRELEKLIRGNPAPGDWAEEFPEDYAEDVFGELIEGLLVECDREHQIIDINCDEAPCMVAWSASPDAEHPATCPKWAAAFGGRAITRVGFDVDCPDGRRLRAELATPQEALLESVDDPDAWDGGRMAHRAAAYNVADWCE